jgi:hypothetical protein
MGLIDVPQTPIPWSDFPVECFWYIAFLSLIHLFIFVIGLAAIAFVPAKEPRQFLRRVRHFALFLCIFLVSGSLFNGVWGCSVYGRMYSTSDYVCGFLPFWPLTQAWLEMPGGVPEDSFFKLQLLWLLFTAGTWGVTILLYRYVTKVCRTDIEVPEAVQSGKRGTAA